MAADGISEDLRLFIYEHVDSVEQLEVLLLLFRTRDRSWGVEDIAAELRTSAESVRTRMPALVAAGVVTEAHASPEAWRFAVAGGHDARVGALAEAYKVRRHTIITLIFSPMKRARPFAGAFVVRKTSKPEDGDG